LLSETELADLETEISALNAAVETDDPDQIRDATEHLGRASEVFAARRMDRSIQVALQGVALTDLETEDNAS
jgi:molecular chaperone HscA